MENETSLLRVMWLATLWSMWLFGCHQQPEPANAADSPAQVGNGGEAVAETGTPPRVVPETLPPVPPEAPAPTAPLPDGTPDVEGDINTMVAIDRERAIIRFIVPGPDHARRWWLASMRRDGALDWVRQLGGSTENAENTSGIEIVGDAVSIVTSESLGNEPRITLHAFALADGSPRFTSSLGNGFLNSTVSDGRFRFDTLRSFERSDSDGASAEIIASSATGIAWRAPIGAPPPPGHDLTLVGDAIALRTSGYLGHGSLWIVFERATGRRIGQVPAFEQSCSDGNRWLVRTTEGLVEVNPNTLATRIVLRDPELSGTGRWSIVDCSFAGATPVVLVGRGHRKALVALDSTTGAIRGHVVLGHGAFGPNGFDPLPPRLHSTAVLLNLRNDGVFEIVVSEPSSSRVVGRWEPIREHAFVPLTRWTGGTVVQTPRTLSIIDASTGELEGRAMVSEIQVQPWQIIENVVWLPPIRPLRLGRRAPRIIELHAHVAPEVRDAVLADMRQPADAPSEDGGRPCPDPGTVVRGDGLGTHDGSLGPVRLTRLPTWDLDILYETARMYACAPGSATSRLLAWFVMEDDRPLRNDNALVVIEHTTTSPARYTLVAMYRHSVNREWNIDASFHSTAEPVRTFDHRPTHAEIDDFLARNEWTFVDDWGRVIAGNVIDDEWLAATGERPWHAFPTGIEQAD